MESPSADLLRLIGLARRAGAVAPGTAAVRRAVVEGEARLVLMATDASSVQLKKIRKTLQNRPIPRVILGDRNTLGAAIGLPPLAAIAVTDVSFANLLLEGLGDAVREDGSDEVEA